jgi:hypothetical protein
MSKIDNEIRLLGAKLDCEETLPNVVCPTCHGGMSNEKSFSITRLHAGYVYNCYRASCDCQGFTPEKAGNLVQTNSKAKPHIKLKADKGGKQARKRTSFSGHTVNISDSQREFFKSKFGFTDEEMANIDIRWSPSTVSYCIPIYDHNGFKVGDIDRSWTGRTPKSINRWNADAANLYFPRPLREFGKKTPIVVVEDFASAWKVNRLLPCAALLGTDLGTEKTKILRQLSNYLVLALDPDATSKALKLSKEYQFLFKKIDVVSLTKDPKDMDGAELRNAFAGILAV